MTAGANAYQWDARGRLKQVTLPGQTVSYGYDALGRRTSRTDNAGTTSFQYDGLEVVADRAGSTTIDYLNGPGMDEKLRQSGGAGGTFYFLQDHLNSVIGLVGTVNERHQYEAFGASNGSAWTRYGYTGRERDAATGLLYYRARWYDSQQGRFLTEDPIGMRGGLNLYSYVVNNPLSFVDPLGLSLQSFSMAFACGFAQALIPAIVIGAAVGLGLAFLPMWVGLVVGGAGAFMLGYGLGQSAAANGIGSDQFAYDLGSAVGSVAGSVAGGAVGYRAGTSGAAGRFLADEGGSAPAGPGSGRLPDDAFVVRGGRNLPENFENGSGVTINENGLLDGVSVNSAAGRTVQELSSNIPHNQIGVTTVGAVRAAGGDVVPSPRAPGCVHCTLKGITPKQASDLFTPTCRNPNK